jgi:hypothetical protein
MERISLFAFARQNFDLGSETVPDWKKAEVRRGGFRAHTSKFYTFTINSIQNCGNSIVQAYTNQAIVPFRFFSLGMALIAYWVIKSFD